MFGPYGGWNYPPNQPVVFIPPTKSGISVDDITQQIAALEGLKKALKEEKKEDKKDDKKKPEPNIFALALLMILLSPITGPIMSRFFQWGLSQLPH